MSEDLHGFPYWMLEFDKDGSPQDPAQIEAFINEVSDGAIAELFIFSHGWNNDRTTARDLYDRFFAEVSKLVVANGIQSKIGVAGVIWPSILWPDDAASSAMPFKAPPGQAGPASFTVAPNIPAAKDPTPAQVNAALKRGYDAPEQQKLIDELTSMLETRTKSDAALQQFQSKVGELLATEGATADPKHPDSAEGAVATLPQDRWHRLLQTMGDRAAARHSSGGGGVDLPDPFKKLWDGAKDVLRVATYWQMKQRAGVVGKQLGSTVLATLKRRSPDTRVHLLGHSFGARLVSFSLSGLPNEMTSAASPVKSLLLLQGAFSHFAFADSLPFDKTRSGGLKGMAAQVDGPLLATHSLRDLAVGIAYPAASFVNGDDAAAVQSVPDRWGAVGNDGEQAVGAVQQTLSAPGFKYPFHKGQWMNLDGNKVIVKGGLPSGAHSDIVHPETAWAALAAAALV